jgi:carbon monoxide dehydrogenase subunit G
MKVTDEFSVSVPIEQAWSVLTHLAGIDLCMPGAQLTGHDGDTYRGKVRIKLGPVISDFAGTARFAEKDDAAYRAVIDARGKDSRGAGNASALITAGLDGRSRCCSASLSWW